MIGISAIFATKLSGWRRFSNRSAYLGMIQVPKAMMGRFFIGAFKPLEPLGKSQGMSSQLSV